MKNVSKGKPTPTQAAITDTVKAAIDEIMEKHPEILSIAMSIRLEEGAMTMFHGDIDAFKLLQDMESMFGHALNLVRQQKPEAAARYFAERLAEMPKPKSQTTH